MFSVFGLCFLLYYLKLSSGSGFYKTVALLTLNMIKPYLSFYIFQVAMSQCVDVP